ncbi:L,D-transpeptidase [Prevotella copri]|uniref:L,D-transpeptidase n=1 Tax=Segatella copri TaxID=165179 RepID=A0A6A7WBS7_9BACT|nr:L,D-transpeptidase [Segatella copri]MQP11882.1 L,D-transpeptidase [Segatella copri]
MQDKTKSKKARNYGLFLLYTITFIVPVGGLVGLYGYFQKQLDDIPEARIIVVSKQDMRLRVYDYKGTRLMDYGIACGKNFGQKHKVGDMKTPEGMFFVQSIEDASERTHDFGDGRGEIQGAYGPYFIRLDTPGNKGIGIHGTHDPLSIGTRATEGCIRLNNNDLVELVNVVRPGMMVLVTTSFEDYEQEQQYIGNKRDSVKNQ